MRVLVIGGTGFIGPEVVRLLCEGGHEVAIVHRGQSHSVLPPGVREIRGDRYQLADAAPALRAFAPDVVLDMFPMNDADMASVANVVRGVARRLVAISSQDVYRAYGGSPASSQGSRIPSRMPKTRRYASIFTRIEASSPAKTTTRSSSPSARSWGTPACKVLSYGSRWSTGRVMTSIASMSTCGAWTTLARPSCSTSAPSSGAGREATSRMWPPPSRWRRRMSARLDASIMLESRWR